MVIESVQLVVSRVLQDVLDLPEVDLADDFFDLGGHSLLAGRVMRQVKEQLGVRVKLADFFAKPTGLHLAELARQALTAERRTSA